jgi:uncharacterized damage-inducible protein DinB
MNVQDLQTLLDYHYWGRDRLLEELDALTTEQFTRPLTSSFASIRDTVAHAHSAEWIWYQRWRGESPTAHLPAGRFPDAASVRSAWAELEQQVRAFINGLGQADVDRVLQFRLIDGTRGASPLWQMVYHLVNHATYHRGQVTTLVRQVGGKPVGTDAIAFFRSRQPT